jgi:hypothetical protein
MPAHVDRTVNGLFTILGFVPPEAQVTVLEISRRLKPETALLRYPQARGYPLTRGGDAHRLYDILGANELVLAAPTVKEMEMAFRNEEGRSCRVL